MEAWRPYSVRGLAPRIQCPVLVLYGEAEAAESNAHVALSALRFINELTCPVSVRMFTFDDGWAATHCQVGALAPMQAIVFDWLDTAVHHPDQLPQFDLRAEVADVFRRYLGRGEATKEIRLLLDNMTARSTNLTNARRYPTPTPA
jgi:hypothetical protein